MFLEDCFRTLFDYHFIFFTIKAPLLLQNCLLKQIQPLSPYLCMLLPHFLQLIDCSDPLFQKGVAKICRQVDAVARAARSSSLSNLFTLLLIRLERGGPVRERRRKIMGNLRYIIRVKWKVFLKKIGVKLSDRLNCPNWDCLTLKLKTIYGKALLNCHS